MNFSGYFLLVASAVLVVSAQQSNVDLVKRQSDTIRVIQQSSKQYPVLTDSYINGTILFTKSANTILEGILEAEKLFFLSPEDAKKAIQQAFDNGRNDIFKSGIELLMSIGRAFAFSNHAAKQGLEAAIQLILRSGLSTLDALNNAETLFNRGSAVGDNTAVLLFESLRLIVVTGFRGSYNNLQESIQKADEALKYAELSQFVQSKPLVRRAQYENYCEAGAKDPVGSVVMSAFNEYTKNALKSGAKFEMVQDFLQILKCALGDFLTSTNEIEQTIENIKIMKPSDAEIKLSKDSQNFKQGIYDIAARITLGLGVVAVKSGYQQNNNISAAILALEEAVAKIFLANETARSLIVIGNRFQGDVPVLGNQAAATIELYGKSAFMQGLLKVGELGFKAPFV